MTIDDYLKLPYHFITVRDGEGDIVIRVAELEGCLCHGSDVASAYESMETMMRLFIEGLLASETPVPLPWSEEDDARIITASIPRTTYRALVLEGSAAGKRVSEHVTEILSGWADGAKPPFQG
jgi:predicted RNase H-like HicB family nuclease